MEREKRGNNRPVGEPFTFAFFLFFYCNMQEQTNNDDDDDDDSSLKHFNPLFVHKTKMRTTKSLLESYLSLVDGENFLKMG